VTSHVHVARTRSAIIAAQDDATAKLVRAFYAAFATGDIDAASRFVSNDFVGHVPGRGLNAGEYWGPDGFATFMSRIIGYAGGTLDVRVPVLSVNGQNAFTREIITLNRKSDPERTWELRFAMHYRLKVGKISEMWVIPEDLRHYDDFWTPPTSPNGSELAATAAVLPGPAAPPAEVVSIEGASSPETLALLADMYDRFWRGDRRDMSELFADDLLVNIVGRGGLSGVYHGWDGYLLFRQKLIDMMGDRYKLELDGIAASDRDAWAVEYIRMNRRWDPTVRTACVLMHFEFRDGKITRMDDFPLDLYAWEAFFTPPDA
jgi:ketosteroid isomerase-like protein